MLVSVNSNPYKSEFESLLELTVEQLNIMAQDPSNEVAILSGSKLEPLVKDVMLGLAVNTPFEDSIELVGGQKFPDIIAKEHYGVEVKTTTQNHWRTTGNSVLETTRVKNIEHVFLLFAKLAHPIEFRFRPYQDVLSEVVVTHSPRYLIDMNLEADKTIFAKIGMSYDTLRLQDNPIKPIVEHYKGLLKPGEELWWMDSDNNNKSSSIIIKIWTNLSSSEKKDLKNRAMVFFPELFSNRGDKFSRLTIWLITSEAVACPNVRDLFTAGGKSNYEFNQYIYYDVPRIFLNLFANIPAILDIIDTTPALELSYFWKVETSEDNKVLNWIELVSEYSRNVVGAKNIDIGQILKDLIEI